jgi:hypothetical protein
MRDVNDSDDSDSASGGGDKFTSSNVRFISAESRQAMLTMLGAALKCNGLSCEQGYMYFCSSSCIPDSNAPASKSLAFLSSALQHAGLYSLVRSLLGAVKLPSLSTSGYLSQPEQFTRLLLRTSLDPQVLYAHTSSMKNARVTAQTHLLTRGNVGA